MTRSGLSRPQAARLIWAFEIVATSGTAEFLAKEGIEGDRLVKKVLEGKPNIEDAILNGEIDLVLNTTEGAQSRKDSKSIRRTSADSERFPYFTTLSACLAAVKAIRAIREKPLSVRACTESITCESHLFRLLDRLLFDCPFKETGT